MVWSLKRGRFGNALSRMPLSYAEAVGAFLIICFVSALFVQRGAVDGRGMA